MRSIEYVRRIRTLSSHPVLVGFGVATPEDARMYAGASDGVVVGSALLKRIGEGERLKGIGRWVREMKGAMESIS